MTPGAFFVSQDQKNPRDIDFQIDINQTSPIPEDQIALKEEVEKCLTSINILFPEGDKRFDEYFRSLLSLARVGLVGPTAQPEVANRALIGLKNDITAREGGKVKNQYMKRLGGQALLVGLPALLTAIALYHYQQRAVVTYFLFLWSGSMAGIWLSFGARKTVVKFEDLHILEDDRLEPLIRLFFAGLLTLLIGLLFSTKTVIINLGAVTTEQINTNVRVALIIGTLCGFSEQALSSRVLKQASYLLDFDKSH